MICRSLKEITEMVNGDSVVDSANDILIQGVSIDSRTINPGNLFIPLIRHKNGHDYIQEAQAKGAVASFWQKDQPNPRSNVSLILVDDVFKLFKN